MAAATCRAALWQSVAREEADIGSLTEREQAYAIVLALEDPLRSDEALLGESRCHRFQPFGKRHNRDYYLRRVEPANSGTVKKWLRRGRMTRWPI